MVAIIVSLAIVAAGLWLTFAENASDMGVFGAMLLVLGMTFLSVNLYMRARGFRHAPAPLTRRPEWRGAPPLRHRIRRRRCAAIRIGALTSP